jgi:hypothetical protein
MLFMTTVADDCEKYMAQTNKLCGQNAEFNAIKLVVRIVTIRP